MEHISREKQCQRCVKRVEALIKGESNAIANMANTAAALWQLLEDISWAGFYIMEGSQLVLGPFQGKPACKRIDLDKGVCGAAAKQNKTMVVPNVLEFPGHIACDSASRSEIVSPICKNGRVVAVMDIDSASFERFGPTEAAYMEKICIQLAQQCQWQEK